jgi:hypothetical protein
MRWVLLGFLIVTAATAGYFVLRRQQAQRALLLLLFLYRAHRHDAAKFLGDNCKGLAESATQAGWPAVKVISSVTALGALFKEKLAPHMERVADSQFHEMRGGNAAMRLDQAVSLAFDGACYIYEAKEMKAPPYIHYANEGLEKSNIARFPFSLVVVLEEWFLNCINHSVGNNIERPVLITRLEQGELVVVSSGTIAPEDLKLLREKPTPSGLSSRHQGLKLIRNIIYYAYGVRVRAENCVSEGGQARIRLSIPLRKSLKSI